MVFIILTVNCNRTFVPWEVSQFQWALERLRCRILNHHNLNPKPMPMTTTSITQLLLPPHHLSSDKAAASWAKILLGQGHRSNAKVKKANWPEKVDIPAGGKTTPEDEGPWNRGLFGGCQRNEEWSCFNLFSFL